MVVSPSLEGKSFVMAPESPGAPLIRLQLHSCVQSLLQHLCAAPIEWVSPFLCHIAALD